jgi:predicted DNA-binding transcriptional regulator YafY
MNRIDRISAILIQLQSRRIVKAADIAERFNISLRTVYRDIKTLEEAGIPLIGEAGGWLSLAAGNVYQRRSNRVFNCRKICREANRCIDHGAL